MKNLLLVISLILFLTPLAGYAQNTVSDIQIILKDGPLPNNDGFRVTFPVDQFEKAKAAMRELEKLGWEDLQIVFGPKEKFVSIYYPGNSGRNGTSGMITYQNEEYHSLMQGKTSYYAETGKLDPDKAFQEALCSAIGFVNDDPDRIMNFKITSCMRFPGTNIWMIKYEFIRRDVS